MSNDRIWSYFQNEGAEAFVRSMPRYDFLVRRAARLLPPGVRILNVGVGIGALEKQLLQAGFQVASLDPDASAIRNLAPLGIEGHVGYIEKMPFSDASFSAVIASEVIEHLTTDTSDAAMLEINRVLAPGGFLLGTVPYRERLSDNAAICPNCGTCFHRWGHQQSFDEHLLQSLIQRTFEIRHLSCRAFVSWSLNPLRVAKSTVKWLMGRLGETIADPHLYFECVKRSRTN